MINVGKSCDKIEGVRSALATYIKPESVDPVIQACKQIFDKAIQGIQLVTGGRGTSKILLVTFEDNKKCICRVTDSTRSSFYIDTSSEIKIMQHINELGVAPRLYHGDPQSCVTLMDHIDNQRLTPEHFEDPKLYKHLAEALSQLHAAPKVTAESTNIFADLEATFKEGKFDHMPPAVLEALQVIRPLEEILRKHQTTALCHKDFHSNNALYDGKKLYIIDWELAANCDPYVDLAFASMFFTFDSEKETLFLKNYFQQDPTPIQKAHFFLMKQTILCLYACRLLRRVTANMDISKEQIPNLLPNYKDFILANYNGCSKAFTPSDLKLFAYMFLREVTRNIKSEEFNKSIELLAK